MDVSDKIPGPVRPATSQRDNEVVLKVLELDSNPICRICYGGSSREKLLKPCKCKGTIEYVHRNCLQRWLEAKNIEACELCHHHYQTKRTRKSCWDWLRQPETQTQRRNFVGDFTCFAFLTPMGIATFWLCAEGAIYYQRVKNSTLETVALIILAIFLVLAYFTWIILCTRYHILLCTRWRNQNWNVRIIDASPTELTNFPRQEPLLATRPHEQRLENTRRTQLSFIPTEFTCQLGANGYANTYSSSV